MKWLAGLLLILIAGCAPKVPPAWETLPEAGALLSALAARNDRHRALDGAAQVGLTVEGKYFSSRQFLLLERPDRLRTDVLTGFGQLVLQLASDGETFAVFLNTEVPGRFITGPASDENISRFLRLPLAVDDLLALLLHDPPLIAFQNSSVAVDGGRLRLLLSGEGQRQELWFDRQKRLVGCRYSVAGEQKLAVEYDKFTAADGFPRRIEIVVPGAETGLKVAFSELTLDPVPDAAQFSLKQPPGSRLEILP